MNYMLIPGPGDTTDSDDPNMELPPNGVTMDNTPDIEPWDDGGPPNTDWEYTS